MASSIVIKLKHGGTRRRFNATVDETGNLDLDMPTLRENIITLFNFLPDTDLTLAYTDEDGDLIALDNEEDLHSVMKQYLNPLEITVKLNGRSYPITTLATSLLRLHSPGYFCKAILFLPLNFARTALVVGIAEIVSFFAKRRGTFMNPLPKLRGGDTKLPSLSSTSGFSGSQKNDATTSETASKICITGQNMNLETYEKIVRRKLYLSAFPSQDNREVQISKELKPVNGKSGEYEFKNSPSVGPSTVSSASSSSPALGSGKNEVTSPETGVSVQEKDHERRYTSFEKLPRKITPSRSPDLECKKSQDLNALKPGAIFPNVIYSGNACFNGPCTGKSGGAKETQSENREVQNSKELKPVNGKSGEYESKNSPSASSSTPELGSGKNGVSISETAPEIEKDRKRNCTSVEKLLKISPSRSPPDQESKKIQDLNQLKPRTTPANAISSWNTNFTKDKKPCNGKPRARETPNVSRAVCATSAEESENQGGYQCDRCWVQIVSGRRFKISEDAVCKRCFEVESRMRRNHAYTPSRLSQVRMRKINSSLTGDYGTITDGAVLAPSTPFKKLWRMRNSGIDSWPKGTKFMKVDGDAFGDTNVVSLQIPENGLPVGSEIEVYVNFIAPELPGQYVSFWQLTSFGVPVGQPYVVFIQVATPMVNKPVKSPGITLNLSPESEVDDQTMNAEPGNKTQKLPVRESPNQRENYSNGRTLLTRTTRKVETSRLIRGSDVIDKTDSNTKEEVASKGICNDNEKPDMSTLVKIAKEAIIRRRLEKGGHAD